ncbi:hypothetical protein OG889_32735 [Streptomyces sp. NBC_00481]|uniref:DUF6907 domain-containing protein n=1 Tax=Streptomyces sp. NBC_00481 TaxID=2975755 RepID=UPI002DDBEDE9|nr:hypothetical protein [Streptomyces sp. NBC_00481]WRY99040.1 hypothetical protein OG889_32735 [Streptomyces sp. NBC_00481]
MSALRTVTLLTIDHGSVTLPEPSWCTGHADHRPDTHRADILHTGPTHRLTHNGQPLGRALIFQAPCSELTTSAVQASVVLDFEPHRGFDAVGLYDLAASLDAAADRLRGLADQLHAVLAGGDR